MIFLPGDNTVNFDCRRHKKVFWKKFNENHLGKCNHLSLSVKHAHPLVSTVLTTRRFCRRVQEKVASIWSRGFTCQMLHGECGSPTSRFPRRMIRVMPSGSDTGWGEHLSESLVRKSRCLQQAADDQSQELPKHHDSAAEVISFLAPVIK